MNIRTTTSHRLNKRWAILLTCVSGLGCQRPHTPPILSADQHNQAWHINYQDGWEAINHKNYVLAEEHFLLALQHAEAFESTDRRLAVTLDDLGLVYFQLGNDYLAEQMQGRAVTELLLTRGPDDPDIAVFLTRLDYIFKRQGATQHTERLSKKPFTIFDLSYVAHDADLSARLDALIYEYERAGQGEAVDYLSSLIYQIRYKNPSTPNSR